MRRLQNLLSLLLIASMPQTSHPFDPALGDNTSSEIRGFFEKMSFEISIDLRLISLKQSITSRRRPFAGSGLQ